MKTLDQMLDDILRREGGYTNHPADKGGPTNFGVTQAALAAYRREAVSAEDVRTMTKAEAKAVYTADYFLKPRINLLPAEIQPFVFDCAVNHGPVQAIRFVQQVCTQLDTRPLGVDGRCGPATAGRVCEIIVNFGDHRELLRALVERRRQFYLDLIARKPSQEAFRKGWMNRLAEFAVDDAQRALILTGQALPPAPPAEKPSKLVSFLNLLRDLLS
jgi:lysozyme family protein